MSEKSKLFDIVIVNYNSTDYLLCCLKSVYASLKDFGAKVIIQDNASTDDVLRARAMFPQVMLSRNTYNMGFSKAVNKAMRQGNAPYIVLLNPDTYVGDNFFSSVLQYMQAKPEVGLFGPRILNRDGFEKGSAWSFPSAFSLLFGRNRRLNKRFSKNQITYLNGPTGTSDGRTAKYVDWVSGACMVVRRKAVDQVGPMDERFFIFWEDADWCKRMWESGWRVVYFPYVSVVHYVGRSREKRPVRSILEFHKSSYHLFRKYSTPYLHFLVPLAFVWLGLRALLVLASQALRRRLSRPGSFLVPGDSLTPMTGEFTLNRTSKAAERFGKRPQNSSNSA